MYHTKAIIIQPLHFSKIYSDYNYNLEWHIISGNGLASLNGEAIIIASGSIVKIPIGIRHLVINNSETEVIVIKEFRVRN